MNAEPVADFLDAALLGDGEEGILDIVEAVRRVRAHGRAPLLEALSEIEGIYVPSFFEPEYNADGTIKQVRPLKEGYTKVNKRVIKEIDSAPYPTKLLVPSVRTVHDRIGVEIQRGCNRACRFCQAGYIDRPVRQRSPETILKIADESYRQTGIDAISLLSLSAADYACLVPLLKELNGRYASKKVALSVPATRTEKMTPELVEQIKQVRKTGFTIAPEAGSERMRRVINKGNRVDDMLTAVRNAFSQGWRLLKLYYMVGLPFETDDDVTGIAREAMLGFGVAKSYAQGAELNVSISSFVPKPFTPFQWEPQMTIAETRRRLDLIRANLTDKKVRLKHHNPEMSYLEGIMSRGDRRVAGLIELAWREGCRFDEWEEHFDFAKWQRALSKWEGDATFYLYRRRNRDEVLPWDHLYAQMDKKFLWEEYEKAHHEAFTEDCSTHRCSDCGVCDFRVVKNRIFVPGDQPVMVKKGNREWYGWKGKGKMEDGRSKMGKKEFSPSSIFDHLSSKIRCRYSKTGEARFLGHLELMGVLKRAIVRAGLPVTYSEGFHPQMKISMGHPLPLGVESEWEYFDLELGTMSLGTASLGTMFLFQPVDPERPPLGAVEWVDPTEAKRQINRCLPAGVELLSAEKVDRSVPSIYSQLQEVDYEAFFDGLPNHQWENKALELLNRWQETPEVLWERETERGIKRFNLREFVDVSLDGFPRRFLFTARVKPEGSVKPQEVLAALFGLSKEDLGRVRLKKTGVAWKS